MSHFLQLISTTILLTLALLSCSATGKQRSQTPSSVEASFGVVDTTHLSEGTTAEPYPMVKIPENIQEPLQRAKYVLEHFFDRWPAETLEQLVDPAAMEQGLVDYLAVYSSMPAGSVSQEDLLRPLKVMRGKALSEALRLYTKYLYESGSPLKNHTFYIQALQWATTSPQVEYVDQVVYKDMLSLVSQNQVGKPATDFAITLAQPAAEGYTFADTTLYALRDKPKVVIFYTPGCDRCTHLLAEVSHDQILQRATEGGKAEILYVSLVYERSEWEKGLADLPPFGTPAFNGDLRLLEESLYDLAVTPVIYVISSDGIVLQRDSSLADVRRYVSTL
ncbi:DUF5106 domain-containing protein [Porphyromonas asaccharolytica]|uniref:DUF5106 domain-containing protein n=1 Tax=Porphyromonas asaccharolytica TaxID=28123 RepID=UPI00248E5A65|nr:DUF5106 domain-containing protein [Porphyromonas asaccharolytica]